MASEAAGPSASTSTETHARPAAGPAARTRAAKYRGATLLDLDPPPALSVSPETPISAALMRAYERDYTHLTVVSGTTRALLGYISMPRLKTQLQTRAVQESDPVEAAMLRFRRRARRYRVITMDTLLEDLEAFFEGEWESAADKQDFAIVTDAARRFVLGVATRWDLDEFVRRRPA